MKNKIATLISTLIGVLMLSACAKDGSQGPQGIPGQDGSSCSVTQYSNGASIECDNGTSAYISNGADGEDAMLPAGYTYLPEGAFYISQIEDLCGNGADEVLFRLNTGELIAHYSSGQKQYLTVLSPGSYVSTDGKGCQFQVGPAPTYTITY